MYLVASNGPSVCVCLSACLNRSTFDFFGIWVNLDIGYPGLVGQGRRSNVTNCVWTSQFVFLYPTLRSRSKVEVEIRG